MSNVILNSIFGIANVIIPRNGPRVAPIDLDFSSDNSIEVDATLLQQSNKMEVLQGAYIDNGENPNALKLIVAVTNQRIIIAPFTQGYYPLLAVTPSKITFETPSTADKKIPVRFYNVPIQGLIWSTR